MAQDADKRGQSKASSHLAGAPIDQIVAADIRVFRSRLINSALIYFAVVIPLTLVFSVLGLKHFGWSFAYLVHGAMAAAAIGAAVLRHRLGYSVRAALVLVPLLLIGLVGLGVFGMAGGAYLALAVFALMAAIAFGVWAGLIACVIDMLVIAVIGLAVSKGWFSYSLELDESAMSIAAWGFIVMVFFLLVGPVVVALGLVYRYFTTLLCNLRESEQRLRSERVFIDTIVQSLPGLFYVFEKGSVEFVRREGDWSEATGYSEKELKSMTALDFFEEGPDRQLCLDRMQEVYEQGSSSMENSLVKKSGEQIPYYFTGKSFVVEGKTYLVGVGLDMSERKHIEEQLRASRDSLKREIELFENFFQTMPDHMYIKDLESRFVRLNRGMVELLKKQDESELIGKTDFDIFTDEHARPAYEDEQEIMRTGIPKIGYEEKETWPDGHVSWCLSTKMPLRDHLGNITGLIGVSYNITGRKQIEAEREKLVKTLEFKNRQLQDIVYSVSHDLRSPLVNIEGFSVELGADCKRLQELIDIHNAGNDKSEQIALYIGEVIPQSLEFITQSTKKMVDLLDGLLQVSRIGTFEMEPQMLDMDKLMGELLTTTGYQINACGAAVTAEPLVDCFADRHLVDRVFTNLISNAIKYLDPNRAGQIHISGRVKNGMSIYCVSDNGIGIDTAHREKVFEIFQRVNPNDAVGGEGLGLTIVSRILDRLDGRVWVESEVGVGSRFFVALPAGRI